MNLTIVKLFVINEQSKTFKQKKTEPEWNQSNQASLVKKYN